MRAGFFDGTAGSEAIATGRATADLSVASLISGDRDAHPERTSAEKAKTIIFNLIPFLERGNPMCSLSG
jgi:hypothetical protein